MMLLLQTFMNAVLIPAKLEVMGWSHYYKRLWIKNANQLHG